MSTTRLHRLLVWCAATDDTFERSVVDGREAWVGRCLHCRRRVVISTLGEPISDATLEHIVPRVHGGTDDLRNIAIACRGCNNEKGVRHDPKRRGDEKLEAVIQTLSGRRAARWRDPPESWILPPLPRPAPPSRRRR